MEKTVHEICLVCRGERWLPDPTGAGPSQPCPYCDEHGWVTVSPASLGEDGPNPSPAPVRKKDSGPKKP